MSFMNRQDRMLVERYRINAVPVKTQLASTVFTIFEGDSSLRPKIRSAATCSISHKLEKLERSITMVWFYKRTPIKWAQRELNLNILYTFLLTTVPWSSSLASFSSIVDRFSQKSEKTSLVMLFPSKGACDEVKYNLINENKAIFLIS